MPDDVALTSWRAALDQRIQPVLAQAGCDALQELVQSWSAQIDRAGLTALSEGASAEHRRIGAGHAAELGRQVRKLGLDAAMLQKLITAVTGSLPGVADDQRRWVCGALHGALDADVSAPLSPELGKILRHDIKTPLQAASLNLELLAMEHDGQADLLEAIATIQQSLDTAVGMLHRFENV